MQQMERTDVINSCLQLKMKQNPLSPMMIARLCVQSGENVAFVIFSHCCRLK
jgi:hypothetical protein